MVTINQKRLSDNMNIYIIETKNYSIKKLKHCRPKITNVTYYVHNGMHGVTLASVRASIVY